MTSEETGLPVSYNIEQGSNVTASLVSQSGTVVATTQLFLNSYLSSEQAIQGALNVPPGVQPGLYDVILGSSYNSYDLGVSVNGSYFGQVYVAPAVTTSTITITPSTVYEGQTVTVNAKIAYANGTSVKYGMYEATIYPKGLQNDYNFFSEYVSVPIWFDSSTGLWTGNATLPSAYNTGGTVQVDQGALYLSGPYDVFIAGVSANGVPSNTDISTQQGFVVQPYLYVNDTTLVSPPQTSQVAFVSDTLVGPVAPLTSDPSAILTGDLFIGSTVQGGSLTIAQSQIEGTLYLDNADVTLIGVVGGNVVAQNSKIILDQSSLSSLQLTNSTVSMNASLVDQVSPSLPTVSFQSPISEGIYVGKSGNITVSGQDISLGLSVSRWCSSQVVRVPASSPIQLNGAYSVPLDSANMSVGVHSLEVVATQQDGLSSSSSVYFSTDGPLIAANDSISSLTTQVSSENSRVNSLSSQLEHCQ